MPPCFTRINPLALTRVNSMSLRPTMIFRLASKQSDGTAANSAQAQPVSPSEPSEPAAAHKQSAAESQIRRQQPQPRSTSASPEPAIDEVAAEIAAAVAELRRRAYENAPRCGRRNAHSDYVLEWMTLSQAADAFRISRRCLSSWATQGLIPSIKGESMNSHRLVHIDAILVYLQQQLRIAKEASLRVSQDADDSPGSDNDSDRAADDDDPMQGEDTRVLSPIIVP